MYAHYSMNVQAAKARQHDLITAAERERKARQFRNSAPASQPAVTRHSRPAGRLLQVLRASAQSL